MMGRHSKPLFFLHSQALTQVKLTPVKDSRDVRHSKKWVLTSLLMICLSALRFKWLQIDVWISFLSDFVYEFSILMILQHGFYNI